MFTLLIENFTYYLSILRSVAFRIRCNALIYMHDLHCWEYGVIHYEPPPNTSNKTVSNTSCVLEDKPIISIPLKFLSDL